MRFLGFAIGTLALGCSAGASVVDPQDAGSGADAASPADAARDADASLDSASPPVDGGPDGSTANGCITDTSVGPHTVVCDGITYTVSVPPACAKGCGLVLDVHGATMDATMEDANTAMRALGAQYGFVVVQPNANPAPPQSSWNPVADDPKVFAFLQSARIAWTIDPKRVHMTGFSQGGMMTFRFLCKHADVFASMAPAAGTGCTFGVNDAPSQEVPLLYMHGTKDALIYFNVNAIPQRNQVVTGWAMGAGQPIAGDTNFQRTRYLSAGGTPFEFLQHDYAAATPVISGHCYPGSADPGGAKGQLFSFACAGTSAFTWGVEVMKFFVAHPKP